MKLILGFYFICMAVVQFGFLLNVYHYSKTAVKQNFYWGLSLKANIGSLITFGASIIFLKEVSAPQFDFTIANTLLFISVFAQLLFCMSLLKPINDNVKILFLILTFLFFLSIEYLRQYSTFEFRTIYVSGVMATCYFFQALFLFQYSKQQIRSNLKYLEWTTQFELVCALSRALITVLLIHGLRDFNEIPALLVMMTCLQVVMTTLSYAFIGNFWIEKNAISRTAFLKEQEHAQIQFDLNQKFLVEKNQLLSLLSNVNNVSSVGALTAGIIHELNQPLASARIGLEFLKQQIENNQASPDLAIEILGELTKINQRSIDLIGDLKTIFNQNQQEVVIIDLKNIVAQVVDIARPNLYSSNIRVTTSLADGSICLGSLPSIRQVLINLINNASDSLLDSQVSDRHIKIDLYNDEKWNTLKVTDNGQGISKDFQNNLFLIGQSTKKTGMGLGLWLCKKILESYGGQIYYEDQQGSGACFVIKLLAA
jgi:signal transduction histidine kinase